MRLSKFVPAPARVMLKMWLRRRALRSAIRPIRYGEKRSTLSERQIDAFHKAWGNEGFAADRTYLARMVDLFSAYPGPVLECGTGGTTVLCSEFGKRDGFDTYSLEQDPDWALPVRTAIGHPAPVHILAVPLRDLGGYMWYDLGDVLGMPQHFGLVICDGPYVDAALGEPWYSAWRYGVLPWLNTHGKTYGALLLDDVSDPRAPAILNRWRAEFGVSVETIRSPDGDCAIVKAPSRPQPA